MDRLNEIRNRDSKFLEGTALKDDFEWLLEQAEQTQSFKQLHKNYLDRYVKSVGEINRLKEENLALKLEVNPLYSRRKLISTNKRYEQALKDIRDVVTGIPHEWARKALEEKK